MSLKQLASNRAFGGLVQKFTHESSCTSTPMTFSIFLPKEAETAKVPVLYYLSGLTCTDDNFTQKAGAQRAAAAHGIALVAPDTSPRGAGCPNEDDNWDFGTGAGFYVTATQPEYAKHYNMYEYVTKELPELVNSSFNIDPQRRSVCGHSMGGHGSLICALKNPGMFRSSSAFSAICNPMNCPWGTKAFSGYLGEERAAWEAWDASCLAAKYAGPKLPILLDQGSSDGFLEKKQLLPEVFNAAAAGNEALDSSYRLQEGYDHSYYFISTFMEDHIEFAAKHLRA